MLHRLKQSLFFFQLMFMHRHSITLPDPYFRPRLFSSFLLFKSNTTLYPACSLRTKGHGCLVMNLSPFFICHFMANLVLSSSTWVVPSPFSSSLPRWYSIWMSCVTRRNNHRAHHIPRSGSCSSSARSILRGLRNKHHSQPACVAADCLNICPGSEMQIAELENGSSQYNFSTNTSRCCRTEDKALYSVLVHDCFEE